MAIAQVQDSTLGKIASATPVTTAFGATPPVAGNYIVVWCWSMDGFTPVAGSFTLTDNATGGTNTYNQVGFIDTGGGSQCMMFWAKVVNTKANLILSFADSNITTPILVAVAAEFSGIAAASPQDGTAVTNTGLDTAPQSGNETVVANDLVCTVAVDQDGANPATFTKPTGTTLPDSTHNPLRDGANFVVGGGAWVINPSSPVNLIWTSGNVNWACAQFALKVAAGATRDVFLPDPMTGLGVGGSFFRNPIG